MELGRPDANRACVLCMFFHALSIAVSASLCRIVRAFRPLGGASPSYLRNDDASTGSSVPCSREVRPKQRSNQALSLGSTKVRFSDEVSHKTTQGYPLPPRKDAFQDLQITIPILKPQSWQEIQPLMHRMPVTFDERGTKETMTVKAGRWNTFVNRQKEKLVAELTVRRRASANADSAEGTGERELGDEEDDSELEKMIENMDDWKDLARYSGKSVSMASTRRGNEMKIHIMAFAERDDGQGVDFTRLWYKKSVEVRRRVPVAVSAQVVDGVNSLAGTGRALSQSILSWVPFLSSPEASPEAEERWIQLLQNPDVAKFAIALAFREALEEDGVRLQFCESRLDRVME